MFHKKQSSFENKYVVITRYNWKAALENYLVIFTTTFRL